MNFSLEGRTYVVMGVANKRSIAWGIARSLHDAGARLIFTYANERFEKPVRDLGDSLEGQESLYYECDVTDDEAIKKTFADIKNDVGTIHGLAHCIAFANRDELNGEYMNVTRDGYESPDNSSTSSNSSSSSSSSNSSSSSSVSSEATSVNGGEIDALFMDTTVWSDATYSMISWLFKTVLPFK